MGSKIKKVAVVMICLWQKLNKLRKHKQYHSDKINVLDQIINE